MSPVFPMMSAALLAAVLKEPIPSSWDSGEASCDLPEALSVLGFLVLHRHQRARQMGLQTEMPESLD
jgi:hypothetical protein